MKNFKLSLLIAVACFSLTLPGLFSATRAKGAEQATYVGAKACQDCHEDQYASYMKNSRKAHSWVSIAKMQSKLTQSEQQECYACHTTGYGKPGGFVSLKDTPDLANVGCESCHGPGSLHAESGDPEEILRTPKLDECTRCHNGERIQNFNFKPMLYHGGH